MDNVTVEPAEKEGRIDHVRFTIEHFRVADEQGGRVADQQADEIDGDGLVNERFGAEDDNAQKIGDQAQEVDQWHDETPDEHRTANCSEDLCLIHSISVESNERER